ncbi:MAG TPA: protein-L-isoaspartate(D-aspartate) O-methyltransferase [Allosphingosinicella sp.]|nr:protein-L-isoaspartate(D-aspartate) O-methyltransferase [Allosphingosinicella sp.]
MMRALIALFALALLAAAPPPAARERAAERERMVLAIENMAAVEDPRLPRRIDPKVLAAMREVPRHLLVPADVRAHAYGNHPLPIGYDATISQPYMVAVMTHLLGAKPSDVVLEVGTGSGYQAAVLSRLVRHVYSIEIVQPLAERAGRQLAELGYANVSVRAGDGYKGWPERAPFDRIIVTAGADHMPKPLIDQLKPGGRMVIPLGPSPESLELTVVTKDRNGKTWHRRLMPVRFVPLTRAD